MGSLRLPLSGDVYLDTSAIIYTVERRPPFYPLMQPMWKAAQAGRLRLTSSALALLECLVGPMKTGDSDLLNVYEDILSSTVHLVPITTETLRSAARLRANLGLKTPDAIHTATALSAGCALFVTNDRQFRNVPGLTISLLADAV